MIHITAHRSITDICRVMCVFFWISFTAVLSVFVIWTNLPLFFYCSFSSLWPFSVLPIQDNHNKAEPVALVCKACFRWARSREVLLNRVSSRLCRINQEGFVSLTLGSSTGWKAFCNVAAVFLTRSRAGESACMSTSQTPNQPACRDAQTDTQQSVRQTASHAGIFTA